jgi:hypothetical protein
MPESPRAGTTLVLVGDRLRFLATAAESGGAMAALEVAMPPAAARRRCTGTTRRSS